MTPSHADAVTAVFTLRDYVHDAEFELKALEKRNRELFSALQVARAYIFSRSGNDPVAANLLPKMENALGGEHGDGE